MWPLRLVSAGECGSSLWCRHQGTTKKRLRGSYREGVFAVLPRVAGCGGPSGRSPYGIDPRTVTPGDVEDADFAL